MYFTNFSSAIVSFLAMRLIKGRNWNRRDKNVVDSMKHRVFLQRMQRMQEICYGKIPHPICSRIQLDLRHLANILFARSPQMLKLLTYMESAAAFKYEPRTVRNAQELLSYYLAQNKPFTIKLGDDKNKIILLHFYPQDEQMWSCTLTWVDRTTCVSYTLDSVRMTMNIKPKIGIFLHALSFDITLFYTNNLKLRIFGSSFKDESFYASYVEFYVQRPQCKAIKVSTNISQKRMRDCTILSSKMKELRCE